MNRFDPQTGAPIKDTTPAPINTRTMLYHPDREPIIVEGKGENDQQRIESAQKQIQQRLRDGYTRERPHGQHPHSFDNHRLDYQRRAAEDGDKKALEALKAKAKLKPELIGAIPGAAEPPKTA